MAAKKRKRRKKELLLPDLPFLCHFAQSRSAALPQANGGTVAFASAAHQLFVPAGKRWQPTSRQVRGTGYELFRHGVENPSHGTAAGRRPFAHGHLARVDSLDYFGLKTGSITALLIASPDCALNRP